MRLHADEVDASIDVARRLIDTQHPRWSGLTLRAVAEFGTDHRLYRLGDELLVRLPVHPGSADQAESDARWLPRLQSHVSIRLPIPLALGLADREYPFTWSVVPWLPGTPPTPADGDGNDVDQLARDLARFVRELHAADADGGPQKTGTSRGVPIRLLDGAVRRAIEECGDRIDRAAATVTWDGIVTAPDHAGSPVWIHGDLNAGNLLVHEGRLAAVIDFGAVGLGDPAADLAPAWSTVATARDTFLSATGYDDDTIRRARGWALAPALFGIPYYWDSFPSFARLCVRTVAEVIGSSA